MRPLLAVVAEFSAGHPAGRSRFAAGLALATVGPLALAPALAPSDGGGSSEILGIFVVVAYAGHVAVTGWLWTVPDVRHTVRDRPLRLIGLPAMLVAGAVAIAVSPPGHVLSWLMLGFFAWQFAHFQRQNLGLVKLVTSKWAAEPMGKAECRIIMFAGWCAIAALLSRPQLLGLRDVHVPGGLAGVVADLAGTIYAICALAAAFGARRGRRPVPVSASYVIAVLFVAPVFVFHSPDEAVTGMVVAHGLQYLWVVRWRSRDTWTAPSSTPWQATLAVVVGAVVGGSVLTAMSELQAAHDVVFRALYGAYFGVVMSHFSVDGVLWRRPTHRAAASRRREALLPLLGHGRR